METTPTGAEAVVGGLEAARSRLEELGVPVPELDGKLMRPTLALALVPLELRSSLDDRFWLGALAVQMAHEASLLHDDIVDRADLRRGRETLVSSRGIATALVRGDHYLTGAYRAASAAGLPGFLEGFIEAVERTVAGEVDQERSRGEVLDPDTYEAIMARKSGSLFAAAALLGGAFLGRADEGKPRWEVGRALGTLYQRVDDLLDYCPACESGKPPLQDHRQRKWTWVLAELERDAMDAQEEAVLERLFQPGRAGSSVMARALVRLRAAADEVVARAERLSPGDTVVRAVVDGWLRAAEEGVAREERRRGSTSRALKAV